MLILPLLIISVLGDELPRPPANQTSSANITSLAIIEDTVTMTDAPLSLGYGIKWAGGATGFRENHAYPTHEGKCHELVEGLITRTACLQIIEEGYSILPSQPLSEAITCREKEACKVKATTSYLLKLEDIEPLYFGFEWEQLFPTNGTNLAPMDAEGNYVTDVEYLKPGPYTAELVIKPILWYTKGKVTWSIDTAGFSTVSFAKQVDLQHIIIAPNGNPDAIVAMKKLYQS